MDAVGQLVDAVAHAGRDLSQTVGVHLHAHSFHARQNARQRELDLAEEPLEIELDELASLLLGQAPCKHGSRGRHRLRLGPFDERLLSHLHEAEELAVDALRGDQVGGDGRIEGGVGRRCGEGGQRLGVVGDHVGRAAPQRRPLVVGDGGSDGGLAAGVGRRRQRLTPEAQCLVIERRDGERRLTVFEQHGQRSRAFLERELGEREGRRLRRGLRADELARPPRQAGHLVAVEELLDARQRRRVTAAADERLDVGLEGHIGNLLRELLREARLLLVLGQKRLTLGRAGLGEVLVEVLHGTELLHELRRGLLPHAGDPRDVVGAVSFETDEVGHLVGGDAVALDDLLRRVDHDLAHSLGVGHDRDVVVDELQHVPVAGDDHRPDPLALRLLGQRGEDVVGLEALLLQAREAEGGDEVLEVGPLLLQQVRHRLAPRLVLLVVLVPEGALARVPGYDDVGGSELGQHLEEHRGEAVQSVGGKALAGGDRLGQREVGAVREAVAVDEKEAAV